jgi:hypothetical protein
MRVSALVVSLLAVLPAAAQTTATAPAPAAPFPGKPALITNVAPSAGDSNLVRAAKLAVAARMRNAAPSTFVINNTTLIHVARSGPPPPAPPRYSSAPSAPSPAAAPAPTGTNQADLTRKREELTQQLNQARVQSDEVYADSMDEELAQKRMQEIPQQIEQLDRKLNAPPPPQ